MARINIEDSIWSDPRFLKLAVRLGDEEKALGRLVVAWRFAQKFWCPERKPIPLDAWAAASLGRELFDVGLARETPEGVYLAGADEQFAWWFQRQEAGKKGGRPKAGPKRGKAAAKRPLSGANRAEPSSSFSSSSSSSSSVSNSPPEGARENAAPPTAAIGSPTGYVIGAYVRAYQARYGEAARPDLRGKVQKLIRVFAEEVGPRRGADLVATYLQMDDPWFKTKAHDFETFLANQNKICLRLDTGKDAPSMRAVGSAGNRDAFADWAEKERASRG
jgi:hypothetical protein